MLELEKLQQAERHTEPFEYVIVPQFIAPDALERVHHDFPSIQKGGSFPVESLDYGPAFGELVNALRGDALRQTFEQVFDMDLSERPTTLTVRGHTRKKDGKIHTDSKTKLITVLLYLNQTWDSEGGRLRLLRSPDDLDDAITEIEPAGGMLVAFRCRENAWHGHKSFEGQRRSLQLNWVVDESAAQSSSKRHRLSQIAKKLSPFG